MIWCIITFILTIFDDHLLALFLMTFVNVHYLTPFINTILFWCIITFITTIFDNHFLAPF